MPADVLTEAVVVTVAKAVEKQITDAQTAAKFTPNAFTIERSYIDWDMSHQNSGSLELPEDARRRVDVVGHMTEQRVILASRGDVQLIVPVDIALREKFGTDQQDLATGRVKLEHIDANMLLLQQLYLMFMPQRLTEFPFSVWDGENGGTQILAGPSRAHLREWIQFTGIIRVTFRVDIKLPNEAPSHV